MVGFNRGGVEEVTLVGGWSKHWITIFDSVKNLKKVNVTINLWRCYLYSFVYVILRFFVNYVYFYCSRENRHM